MKKVILIIGVLLFLAGAVLIVQKSKNAASTSTGTDNTTSNSSESPKPAVASTDKVTISDFKFGPPAITVKKGTTVTWTNQDSVAHTVTADALPGPDSPLIAQGETYTFTFNQAGTFTYHCKPHPYMTGSVVVTD